MTSLTQQALAESEARDLTQRIKDAAESIWALLLEAHDRQAWKALGYSTWVDYVEAEFNMSKQHSFRLLDQARVIREIGAVAESPVGDLLTEREARDIKPVLDEVKAEIADAVRDIPAGQPDQVQQKVHDVVAAKREQIRAARPTPAPVQPSESIATVIATAKAEARTSPSYVASKAFEQFIYAQKIIDQAGGVENIISDLSGEVGHLQAENWLGGLDPIRKIIDDWCQQLDAFISAPLRRVK